MVYLYTEIRNHANIFLVTNIALKAKHDNEKARKRTLPGFTFVGVPKGI